MTTTAIELLSSVETWVQDNTWERVYTLPDNGEAYKIVNGAVAYALDMMSRGQVVDCEEVAGRTKYRFTSRDGLIFQLTVLYTGRKHATVKLDLITPTDPAELATWYVRFMHATHTQTTLGQLSRLFKVCHEQIATQLRRAIALDDCDPPPPPKDVEALLTWAEVYRPTMTDRELAALAAMEVQSIRNARHRLNKTKITPRGRPK